MSDGKKRKKSGARKLKNVKAVFLLGSALNHAGRRSLNLGGVVFRNIVTVIKALNQHNHFILLLSLILFLIRKT
jgi:hypothetical protein